MEQTELSPAPKTHSKIGIAAFVLGVIPLCIFAAYIAYLWAFIVYPSRLTGFPPPFFYALSVIVCAVMAIADIILFVWALFQKGTRKALPIVGFVLTLVSVVLWAAAVITLLIFMA